MGFWVFMLIMCLLIPGMLLLFGWIFQHCAPKSINGVYGYRTKRSMRDQSSWDFAQAMFGKLAFRWGLGELPIVLLAMLPVLGRGDTIVGTVGGVLCIVLCLPFFVMIWQIEWALKQQFPESKL